MDDREVERLRDLAGKLSGLMRDPHPGLWTWNAMVAEVLSGLAPAPGPATEANTWVKLEDRVPAEGRVVLLARYSGSDTDFNLTRYFRPDWYGPGGRQWFEGWRWAMVVEPPAAAIGPPPPA